MRETLFHRLLGGSPAAVLVRLLLVSFGAGALMAWMDVDPWDVLQEAERVAARLYATGFEGFARVLRMTATGAAIVIPVWLVVRLLNVRSLRHLEDERGPLPGAGPDAVRSEPKGWRRRSDPSPSGP